jgi:hypothetical protein
MEITMQLYLENKIILKNLFLSLCLEMGWFVANDWELLSFQAFVISDNVLTVFSIQFLKAAIEFNIEWGKR